MKNIKQLMLEAIEDKNRPLPEEDIYLDIWNQPFFGIDKATILTIASNPTAVGAKLIYPHLLAEHLAGSDLKIFRSKNAGNLLIYYGRTFHGKWTMHNEKILFSLAQKIKSILV